MNLSLSRSLALSLTASLSVAISTHVHAGECDFQILGGTTINSLSDNVGTYACDSSGTCVLIDSYFDASAPYTPIASDEEEIDVAPGNPNANSAGGNTSSKTGAALSSCSGGLGGGSGGGGGSSAPTLPQVITTAPRPERYVSVRPFYRAPVNGNGGAPNAGTRAMGRKDIKSSTACSAPKNVRRDAAVAAYVAAFPLGIGHVTVMFVTTSDGKSEVWGRTSPGGIFDLVSSDCANPYN